MIDQRLLRWGTVEAFDDARGYGEVDDGRRRWWFHSTAVADGSRRVPAGVEVVFRVAPGHGGRFEATSIQRCDGGAPARGS